MLAVLITVCLLLSLPTAGMAAPEARPPDLQALLAAFGFPTSALSAVRRGEILTRDAPPTGDNEVAGTVAMRIPLPVASVAERMRAGVTVAADDSILAMGEIEDRDTRSPIDTGFDAAEGDDARALLAARPGFEFNLSSAEFARVRATPAPHGDSEALTRAADLLNALLNGRLATYRARGIAGLADYDRGEDPPSSPSRDLARALDGGSTALPPALRSIAATMAAFPRRTPGVDSRLYWKKVHLDDRANFMLDHVILQEQPGMVTFAVNEFYVANAFNALQQLGIAVDDRGGTVMLMLNRTTTERITGMFGDIARTIAEHRLRNALAAYFTSLRDALLAGAQASGG